MFKAESYTGTKEARYESVVRQLAALLEGETDRIANLANASALLHQFLSDVNWVGFYILKHQELVLGPFQGLPACVRIPLGKGVCGTSAQRMETMRVDDVHAFPGHIACDAASRSEIVVPIIKQGQLLGVLDIDSPLPSRFDEADQRGLEAFAEELAAHLQLEKTPPL
ncbi:Free methionine-R-sulfoxide reductase [Paenibacillus konkukensis]|uniref:Free methionine-R-sulfoxide reductase n=1 Tax=Paenibacillus konkukensis TaxID=2020716 RepID=A0ABY4RDK0_9BACL|nr:GAF domain-containing protein [Paenibacillus konkukensis]UQZ80896.1 Free methionine-R-sulfoxide reductase [Paenibacillus konkukensis]